MSKQESVRRVEEDYKASINTSKNRTWSHSTHQLITEYKQTVVGDVNRILFRCVSVLEICIIM